MGSYIHYIQSQAPGGASTSTHALRYWLDGGTLAASSISGTTVDGEPFIQVSHERPAEFSLPIYKQWSRQSTSRSFVPIAALEVMAIHS